MNFPCDRIVLDGIHVIPLHPDPETRLVFRIDTKKKLVAFYKYKESSDPANPIIMERELIFIWDAIKETDVQHDGRSNRIVIKFHKALSSYHFCYAFVSDDEVMKRIRGPLACLNNYLMQKPPGDPIENVTQTCTRFGTLDIDEDGDVDPQE